MTRRTHCENGHSYKKEGTYERPDGKLACRGCLKEADARYREKQRAKKNNPAILVAVGELRVK